MMQELQIRKSALQRCRQVMVIDMIDEIDKDKAANWMINTLGWEECAKITTEFNTIRDNGSLHCYLIVDIHAKIWEIVSSWEEVKNKCSSFSLFSENDKSTFPYWFAHWCAFQLTALNLGIWKFKYLFHDAEKPWLKLFMPYNKVKKWHREHNSHHLEYGLLNGWNNVDWHALMIDWECSQFSKKQCRRNCREEMEAKLSEDKWKPHARIIREYLETLLDIYML